MKKVKLNKLLMLFMCGIAVISTAFNGVNLKPVSAEEQSNVVEYRLSEEIGKMQSIDLLSESVFSFYAAVYWSGPYLQFNYADLDGSIDAGVANYSKIQVNQDYSLTPFGATAGTNTVFSYTGSHTVGRAESAEGEGVTVDRTWAIGWTAPENGTLTISSSTLEVNEFFNADLSMGFSKGSRAYIDPNDATLNWKTYQSSSGANEYAIEEQKFSVSAGETVFINLYAKAKEDVDNSVERWVNFSYDPVFKFEKMPDTLHLYNHMQKLSRDEEGALENNVRITVDDETTYPFSYLYRSTAGADYGFAGQESGLAVGEMIKATANIDPTGLRLYAPETYSGFLENGVIVNIARSPDPMNVILGFTAPHDGALSISDLALSYGHYPNNTNGYTNINGTVMNSAYKGVAFRVLLNGKQVWPANGGWDNSLAKLYTEATNGYAEGDLIKAQSTGDIKGIKVKKYDEIYFELTRADLTTTEDCDTITFNPTFTIDETADMSDYVYYVTASEYFDITNYNSADSVISYWGIDTTQGLYRKANYKLMSSVDFSSLTYTTSILEDNASDVGWNYFRPKRGEDAAIAYCAPYSGNLTICAETIFRGGNMALWEAFDLINKGSPIETDGVRMRIEINGQRVWPSNSPWMEYIPRGANDISGKGVFYFDPITLGVLPGDVVTIRVNCGEKSLYDGFNFNPIFALVATNEIVNNPTIIVQDPIDVPLSSEDNEQSSSSTDSEKDGKSGCKGFVQSSSLFALAGVALIAINFKRKR